MLCSSDYRIINFYIRWLEKFFDIKKERLAVNIGINEIHRDRDGLVKYYWSKKTGVGLDQFRKTSFKKSRCKKIYTNHDEHFGTFNVKVLRPGDFYYKILGLIEGPILR